MKTKTAAFAGTAIFLAGLLVLSSLLVDGTDEWRTVKIYEGDASFVQLEVVNGQPTAAFSTDSGIVLAEKQVSGFPFFHPLEEWLWDPGWELENITEDENAGFYLSMKQRDGKLYMAHQYSTLGDRKLGYTYRSKNGWKTEKVDSHAGTGQEPGMYASLTWLEDDPIIFHHTAGGDKFVKARKVNGSWEKEILGTELGWYTSSGTCGEKTFAAYNSRKKRSLYTGSLDKDGWNSEKLDGNTHSSTSVEAEGCILRAAYHNSVTGNIIYYEGGKKTALGKARLSRLSLDYKGEPHISYYNSGEGLYYVSPKEGSWKSRLVDGERNYAGEYNDLEIYYGDPAILYTAETGVFYTEYRTKKSVEAYEIIRAAAALAAFLALLTAIYFRYELIQLGRFNLLKLTAYKDQTSRILEPLDDIKEYLERLKPAELFK